MKKIILLATLLLSGLTQAQVITATGNGEAITEGKTFTFTSLGEFEANLGISVTNVSNANINLKLKANYLVNSDGSELQFCFGGECYNSIETGSTVPSTPSGVTLKPGEKNNQEDHFFNNNVGGSGNKVIYNLSFIQVDDAGKEIATLLTFNYKYSATAGTNDFTALKNIGITVNNTVVKNTMDVTANQNATLEVYTLNGQKVKSAAIKSGSQSVDLSALSTGVYIAGFKTGTKTSQIRIVKN